MINTDFINADEKNYYIDENSLLTIVVDKLGKSKNNVEIGLIKLLTKSEKKLYPVLYPELDRPYRPPVHELHARYCDK